MRRITLWITATLAVLALLIAYQVNAGAQGKADCPQASSSSCAPADPGHVDKPGEAK
jgi:hypothetical protein